jgi:hypothetical protein
MIFESDWKIKILNDFLMKSGLNSPDFKDLFIYFNR